MIFSAKWWQGTNNCIPCRSAAHQTRMPTHTTPTAPPHPQPHHTNITAHVGATRSVVICGSSNTPHNGVTAAAWAMPVAGAVQPGCRSASQLCSALVQGGTQAAAPAWRHAAPGGQTSCVHTLPPPKKKHTQMLMCAPPPK